MTSKSDDGTSATFSGFVFGNPDDLVYSVYPVPDKNGTISITQIDGANHNAPMAGTISNGIVNFDYACGLVRMVVEGADEMTISVVPNGATTEVAGGTYKFNPQENSWSFTAGDPITVTIPENDIVYIPVYGTETKQEAKLTATFSDNNTEGSGVYNVTVVEDGLDATSIPEITVNANNVPTIKEVKEEDLDWEDDYTLTISTVAELKTVLNLVAEDGFEGKTIKLDSDINLANLKNMGDSFTPIGSIGERDSRGCLICKSFKGTFDGQGHTIKNLYQSGWDMGYEWGQYGSIGLFAELEGATVKNLIIDGMEAQVEGGDISFIAGSATGTCVFENIIIRNSKIGTFNNGCGGIIGWSGAGNYTFKNITLESSVVLAGLWGSFDSSIGGIVGQAEPGATYNFENVTINCRIDAYNDVTAAYKYYCYRMCGMIIGRCEETITIDGRNYPDLTKYNISFNNVEVNFGEWMNYHYCVVEGKTAWRVEPGYAYGGIPADHDHSTCAMHCNLYKPFDVLIGGKQYGVYGHRTLDNAEVKVTYPASYDPNH